MILTTALLGTMLLPMTLGAPGQGSKSLTFNGAQYIHRYSKGITHEFTPKSQSDLNKWTDMVTLNVYENVQDGDSLATAANTVLDNYQAAGAKVVRTNSIPRTATKPAEHLIVVLFPQPKFVEAAFARFAMDKSHGVSVVYSHRIYGTKAGDAMGKWIKANGQKIENALMKLPIPQPPK